MVDRNMKFVLKDARIRTLLFTGLCSLLLPATLHAQNVISMGVGEGPAGEQNVNVIVTATYDVPVHGYQIAFTYPRDQLSLIRVSTAGTEVAVLEPDFVGSKLDNQLGSGSMAVILTLNDSASSADQLPPTPPSGAPTIIARLTFSVRNDAVGGTYPLKLVDGIGSPAQFNRFSSEGQSIVPTLVDGAFFVSGTGNKIMLGRQLAIAGASQFDLGAYAQHAEPLDGFQIAFTYEDDSIRIDGATYAGTRLGLELGNAGLIEFFDFTINDDFDVGIDRATVSVLFDYLQPFNEQQLSPNPGDPMDQSLIAYNVAVLDPADDDRQWQELFMDDINVPGVLTSRLIIGTQSVLPGLVHGKIYFSTGDLSGQVIDTQSGSGVEGVMVTTNPDDFVIQTASNGFFRFDDIPPGDYSLRFTHPQYYSNRVTGIVVDGLGQNTAIGDVNIFKIPPAVQQPFVRGFINPDATIDLSDAIFLLNHLFQGATAPTCMNAADFNDDERADISDAISILFFLFENTGNAPPPPFSTDKIGCELDPSPGELPCEEFECAE